MGDKDSKIIYDLLQEVRIDQKTHSKELAKQSICLAKMEMSIQKNTADLSEHKEGVIQCRKLIQTNAKRIEKLEEPKRFIKFLLNKYTIIVGALSGTLGAVLLVLKLINLL